LAMNFSRISDRKKQENKDFRLI
jgi:hypothetical protein